jgi:hypothetical protein
VFFFSIGLIVLLFLEDILISLSFFSLLFVSVFLNILFFVEDLLKIDFLLLVILLFGEGSFFSSSFISLIISDCCGIYFFDVLFLTSKSLISL